MDSCSKQLFAIGGVCLGVLLAPAANAASIPWVGTADYTAAPGATGDEDMVGPFSSYDFASGGVVLIRPSSISNPGSFTVGDTYQGFYQAYVTRHMLHGNTVESANLNTTGSGSGYELTVGATFTEEVVSVDSFGNPTFAVTGGNASVYFDTNPNMDFLSGSGFNDGSAILTGTITGGSGTYLAAQGLGVSSIDLSIAAGNFNSSVFDPDTIVGSEGVFTLQFNPTGPTSQISAVLNNQVSAGDLLLEADGNLNLLAVPLPAPVWLLGTALAGLIVTARRKSQSNAGSGSGEPTALPA